MATCVVLLKSKSRSVLQKPTRDCTIVVGYDVEDEKMRKVDKLGYQRIGEEQFLALVKKNTETTDQRVKR